MRRSIAERGKAWSTSEGNEGVVLIVKSGNSPTIKALGAEK